MEAPIGTCQLDFMAKVNFVASRTKFSTAANKMRNKQTVDAIFVLFIIAGLPFTIYYMLETSEWNSSPFAGQSKIEQKKLYYIFF
jgi:hypothetical protein